MAPTVHAVHVRINDIDSAARRDLSDRNLMHKRVMSMFGHSASDTFRRDANILWRVDDDVDGMFLFVTSTLGPDHARLPETWGTLWGRYNYSDYLQRISDGDRVHFEIAANPTRVKTTPRGKTREPLTGEDATNWWTRRAEQAGLRVEESATRENPLDSIARFDSTFALATTEFHGVGTVTDAELLHRATVEGIGRGKAYGLGMLTVSRV